jgi:hypothetical protein
VDTIRTLLVSVVLALALASSNQSWGQSTAHMGTLTCVISPASKEPFGVERELSCNFEPFRGARANLTGVVKRLGADAVDDGKLVMVWTVFGPSIDTPPRHLEGNYVGSLGSDPRDGLVGGKEQTIHLKPLTAAPEFVNAALSILELELHTTEV